METGGGAISGWSIMEAGEESMIMVRKWLEAARDAAICTTMGVSTTTDPDVPCIALEAPRAWRTGGQETEQAEARAASIRINRGHLSVYSADKSGKVAMTEARILLCEDIARSEDMRPVMELAHENDVPLLIIARRIEGVVLAELAVNSVRGTLNVCVVGLLRSDSPANLDSDAAARQVLDSCVSIAGGRIVSGSELRTVTLAALGTASWVESTPDCTTLAAT